MKGFLQSLLGIVASIIGFVIFLALTIGPWWFGTEIVAYGKRLWRERNPEPAACAQMIADIGRLREALREGTALVDADTPRDSEKLESLATREEQTRLSLRRAMLERDSCYESTLRTIAAEVKQLEVEQVEFAEAAASADRRAAAGLTAPPAASAPAPAAPQTMSAGDVLREYRTPQAIVAAQKAGKITFDEGAAALDALGVPRKPPPTPPRDEALPPR